MDATKVHEKLIETGQTLALAESCTGGHLSACFTSLSGASNYFLGSLIAYSNELKSSLLKVDTKTLEKWGAVSKQTALQMWQGLILCTNADYGIAITGVAGPLGGTKINPVGTVFLAIGKKGKEPRVIECHFEGERLSVIEQTCIQGLRELDLELNQK